MSLNPPYAIICLKEVIIKHLWFFVKKCGILVICYYDQSVHIYTKELPSVSHRSLSIAYLVQIVHNHVCGFVTSTNLRVLGFQSLFALYLLSLSPCLQFLWLQGLCREFCPSQKEPAIYMCLFLKGQAATYFESDSCCFLII